jgi:hypothetical protein
MYQRKTQGIKGRKTQELQNSAKKNYFTHFTVLLTMNSGPTRRQCSHAAPTRRAGFGQPA